MSDSVSLGVQKMNFTETHKLKVKDEPVKMENQEEEEEEVDQMSIFRYFQSAIKPFHSCSSSKFGVGKPLEKKKRTKGPKFETNLKSLFDHGPTKSERCKRKRVIEDIYEDSEVETSNVIGRAEEIKEKLAPEFPSFIKLMLRSHVTKGFWLGLPSEFCKMHLPRCDEKIVLEGESGKEYETNFLAGKLGLSGGWRGFSIAHKLVEGDVVVFQLVQKLKFKLYIIRANDLADVDGALGLLNLDAARESDFEGCKDMNINTFDKAGEKHLRPLSPEIHEEKLQKTMMAVNVNTKSADPAVDEIDYDNFKIVLHGSSIDSELPNHVRTKYYELCRSQKLYLHHQLVPGVNSTLAAGIIAEVTNIADAIRACKLSTSRDNLAVWNKTLEAFELLGMEVGFLRNHLGRLLSLVSNPEREAETKRIIEARVERDHAQDEASELESKLQELKRTVAGLDDEISSLEVF